MSRWLAPLIAVALLGVAAPAASATPRLCTAEDLPGSGTGPTGPNPGGITITHLYAKIGGVWQEPQNVCVSVRFEMADPHNRYVQYSLVNSGGFYLNLDAEPHMPAGTLVSLGFQFPPGVKPVTTSGGYRDGIVAFTDNTMDVQARVAPWTYVNSAFNQDKTALSGTIDCSTGVTTFTSTFIGFIRIQSIGAAGTASHEFDMLQGTFMEGNGVGAPAVSAVFDDEQHVKAVNVDMEGCGDKNPSTHEGRFSAFVAAPALEFLGVPANALQSAASLISRLMQIRDPTGTTGVKTHFKLVKGDDLQFEPIEGVTFAPFPDTKGPYGLFVTADFSFSTDVLAIERRKANVSAFNRCRAAGGSPRQKGRKIVCRRPKRH